MRAVRGLAAALALLAGLVGIPVGLVILGGDYLPTSWPSWTDFVDTLTSPDSGRVFLGALVIIGWIAWAAFAASVVVELPAQLRGVRAPRLPALGGFQRLAAGLIAAALVLLPAAGGIAGSGGSATPAAPAPISALATPAGPVSAAAPTSPVVDRQQSLPSGWEYAVQRGDTLWGLAERFLGDGARYAEIQELSGEIVQPDGSTAAPGRVLRPGWVLQIPGIDPTGAPAAPSAAPATAAATIGYVVAPGDMLRSIAAQLLGDEMRWPEIYALNAGAVQADGEALTDPDVIETGWTLQVPVAAASPQVPSPAPDSPLPPVPPSLPEAPPLPAPMPETPAPEAPTPEVPKQQIPKAPTTPELAEAEAELVADSVDAEDLDGPLSIGLTAGIGGLLAGALLLVLGRRRQLARRRRKPGQQVPPPPPMGDLELAMRCAERPGDIMMLDRALRSLSVSLASHDRVLPDLRTARISETGLYLHVADGEGPAVAPFASVPGEESTWQLIQHDPALLPVEAAADIPAPYPSLVSLGQTDAGDLLLVDLETAAAVSLSGQPAGVRAVLVAMAAELALAQWADHLQIGLVGIGDGLPEALDTDRIRVAGSVEEVLDDLQARSAEIDQALSGEADSVADARTRQVAGDAWTPQILLTAEPLSPAQQQRLAELVDVAPHTALAAVVTLAAGAADELPGPWRITVPGSVHDAVLIEAAGERVTLQRLEERDYQDLIDDLRSAVDVPGPVGVDEQIPAEPAEPLPPLPAADLDPPIPAAVRGIDDSDDTDGGGPDDGPDDDGPDDDGPGSGDGPAAGDIASIDIGADTATVFADQRAAPEERELAPVGVVELPASGPEIRVLGEVDIVGVDPDGVSVRQRNRLVELAAWLALRPGCTAEQVSHAMAGLGQPWAASTRQSSTSRLRAWLGRDATGQPHVPLVDAGRYRLGDQVRTDWHRFGELMRRGLDKGATPAGVAELTRALDLVRGQPFAGALHGRYLWADVERAEMIASIVDVAHTLAIWHTTAGRISEARRAVAVGLSAEPGSEPLYRDLLRAEHRAGNRPGIVAAADRITAINDALGTDPDPETEDLVASLLDQTISARFG